MNAKITPIHNEKFEMSVEQFNEVTQRLTTIQADVGEVKTDVKLMKKDNEYSEEALKRAFSRIETLEKEHKELAKEVNKTAWVPVLITAIVTAMMVAAAKSFL